MVKLPEYSKKQIFFLTYFFPKWHQKIIYFQMFFFSEMKLATQKTPETEESFQLVSISLNNRQKNHKNATFFIEN